MNIPKQRCDGWTDQRRDIFIAALAESQSVTRACAAAGKSPSTVYRLYRRDAGFAARWDKVMADRRAALLAVPRPQRDTGSVAQLMRLLTPSKRTRFERIAAGSHGDIDATLAAFLDGRIDGREIR